jgi:hypothetical protein
MSSYQKYKENIKATNVARRSAIRVLIENHREEFDNIYLEEARKIGLNPTKIEAQVKKVELAKKVQEDFSKEVELRARELIASANGEI